MTFIARISLTSREYDKRFHLTYDDVVHISTNKCDLLRGIISEDKGKGRYKVVIYDKPKDVEVLNICPIRISEKSLTALHFIKEKVEGNDVFVLYDMAWQPRVGISVVGQDNGEKTYHLVLYNKFSDMFLKYTGCTDNNDFLDDIDALGKTKVMYIHDMQHLFYRITGDHLILDWDIVSDECNWQEEIETLSLTKEDNLTFSYNNDITRLIITLSEEILDKYFWIPKIMLRDVIYKRLVFEDYDIMCQCMSGIFQKKYKNVLITGNGSTFSRKIKRIYLSPPPQHYSFLTRNINYIMIELEEDNMSYEEKMRKFDQLGYTDHH